jgi:hypothetical protein
MKKALVFVFAAALATSAFAQGNSSPELNADHGNSQAHVSNAAGHGGGGSNLTYHTGGKVIRNAHVVLIFWGSFPSGYTTNMQNFRNQFGTTGEFNTITQYTGIDDATGTTGAIALTNLAGGPIDYFDTSTPPANCTDAVVQSEVKKVVAAQGSTDYSAIYEVFIPSGSYSSDGSSTSCGGPNLAYCAYHSHYVDGSGKNVKYSIEPWAGCSGCQAFGNTSLDQEHFVCHETREAVTDALGNAWFDRTGNEADDKCAWTPSPFIGTGGFGYQYEWSNANSGCIKTR